LTKSLISRTITKEEFEEAVKLAKKYGFKKIYFLEKYF
jgi:uncharacterized Fe-S radical SAM superfamily protein PflX